MKFEHLVIGYTNLLRTLVAIALSLAVSLISANARANQLTDCIEQKVVFNGIAPLHYKAVSALRGPKVYLHTQYPECGAGAQELCKAPAYVLPGDVIAVAKTCGSWAYVQYIGTTRVTVGWVSADLLIPDVKYDEAATANREAPNDSERYRFKLARGHGLPVCEAYLQRLNMPLYPRPPYCGRPESDALAWLHGLEAGTPRSGGNRTDVRGVV